MHRSLCLLLILCLSTLVVAARGDDEAPTVESAEAPAAALDTAPVVAEEPSDEPKVEAVDQPKPIPPSDNPIEQDRVEERKLDVFPLDDPAWLEDPFMVLGLEMDQAQSDLLEGFTRPPAKVTQPRILGRLDQMIEMLEKQCNGSKMSPGQGGKKGAEDSFLRKSEAKTGELHAADEQGRRWGKLSPKDRDKILKSRDEGFPPGFEDVLADYYRRVSRGDAEGEAPPASSAAE